jgi:hypothetical protein
VGKDHRCRVCPERCLHHFARIDARLRQRSPEKLFDANNSVLRVQMDADKDFVRQSCELEPE